MAGKKKTRATKSPGERSRGRMEVLIEQVRSDFRLAFEGISTVKDELRSEIADMRSDLSGRMSNLELAVQQHSLLLANLKTDVTELKVTWPSSNVTWPS